MDVLHGDKISVGPPYYRVTFVPIFILLFILVSVGPMLNWKRDEMGRLLAPCAHGRPRLVGGVARRLGRSLFGVRSPLLRPGPGARRLADRRRGHRPRARRWRARRALRSRGSLDLARATPLAVMGLVIAHAGRKRHRHRRGLGFRLADQQGAVDVAGAEASELGRKHHHHGGREADHGPPTTRPTRRASRSPRRLSEPQHADLRAPPLFPPARPPPPRRGSAGTCSATSTSRWPIRIPTAA